MEGGTVTSMITTVMADVGTVFSSAVDMVTGNAVGAVFIGLALAGAGIKLFRKIRH